MPTIEDSLNVSEWLCYTRSTFKYLPIEFQLVLLYEIIVKLLYLRKPEVFKHVKGKYIIGYLEFVKQHSKVDGVLLDVLWAFRNSLVHLGYYRIQKYWEQCLAYTKELNALASACGVTLNWTTNMTLNNL